MENIYVFIHCCTIGERYKEILDSQVKRIISSGLYDVLKKIYIFSIGPIDNLSQNYFFLSKIKCQHLSYDPLVGESATMRTIGYMSSIIEPEALCLYLHTKGVTYWNFPVAYDYVTAWRKYLEYFMVDKWKECIKKLKEGYHVVGTELKNKATVPKHFAGNMWWTRFKTISGNISKLENTRNGVEFWIIADERLSVWNMHNSNKNLYLTKIEEKEYMD
jgi:hypothetical protein